ncbi:hypothetical protein VTN00DRAFT_6650 [Thermoascus crustaceus]|uniref:uncharacterized protein n=1 Tax=Thermoascus crustaceus TaxID=5088 RepID=UPI0037439FB7
MNRRISFDWRLFRDARFAALDQGITTFSISPCAGEAGKTIPLPCELETPVNISDAVEKQPGLVKQEPQSIEVPVEVEGKAITISSHTSPGERLTCNSTALQIWELDRSNKIQVSVLDPSPLRLTKYLRDVCLRVPGKPLQTKILIEACYLTTTRTRKTTLLWMSKRAELIQGIFTPELAPILKRSDVSTS